MVSQAALQSLSLLCLLSLTGCSAFVTSGASLAMKGRGLRAMQASRHRPFVLGLSMEDASSTDIETAPNSEPDTADATVIPARKGAELRAEIFDRRADLGAKAAGVAGSKLQQELDMKQRLYKQEKAERNLMRVQRSQFRDFSGSRKAAVDARLSRAKVAAEKVNSKFAEIKAEKETQRAKYMAAAGPRLADAKKKHGKAFRQELIAFRTGESLKRKLEQAKTNKYRMDIMNVNPTKAFTRGFLQKGSPLVKALDLAGNKCFDPLDLARVNFVTGDKLPDGDDSGLRRLAEAEIRHCRAAMLAILGGPGAPYMKAMIGADFSSKTFAIGVLAIFALTELMAKTGKRIDSQVTAAGDVGLDPLLIYPRQSKDNKFLMRYREVNNGRVAMLAITVWALGNLFSGTTLLF